MSDEIDLAQLADTRIRESAIARARTSRDGHGADACEDCGQLIETLRRRALPSATRCVVCQEIVERRRRRGRGA